MTRRFYVPPAATRSKRPRLPHLAALPRWVWLAGGLAVVVCLGWWGITATTASRPRPSVDTAGAAKTHVASSVADTGDDRVTETAPPLQESVPSTPLPRDTTAAVAQAPTAEAVRVQVLNGCGVRGVTRLVTPGLRAKGFDVREIGNARHFGYARSLVIDRTGGLELGLTVADSLGIEPGRVSAERSRNLPDIDVTLVVGADYAHLNLTLSRPPEE